MQALADKLSSLIREQPLQTVDTMTKALQDEGYLCSRSGVYRALRHAGFTNKVAAVRVLPDKDRIDNARRLFAQRISAVDVANMISVDETSFDSWMTSRRGYAPRGQRLRHEVVAPRRQRCTLILGVRPSGEFTSLVVPGSAEETNFVKVSKVA
jgi:hypothetical protein